jgi:phage terminase small subunit
MANRPPAQLSFAAMSAELADAGVGRELPEGASDLTKREFAFVTRLLQHGQMARAAREAGYAEESAGVIATETLRKPKVHGFYRRCLSKVANNAEQLVIRVYERSALFHAKCLECAQQAKELETLMLVARKENAKNGTTVEYETQRELMVRMEKHYAALATQQDTLLATLLGKLNINISGDVNVNHAVLNDPLVDQLIQARRRVMDRPGAVEFSGRVEARN